MRESYDFNVSIRTLKKELPETSQIGIGDDVCLFNIKYNGIDDKFSKPIRLVGNVMVFCVKGSVHMSVNLNEYDVKEGCLVVLTDQDIVKVEKGSDDDIKNLHWVVIAMSQNFLTNLRVDFRKILRTVFSIFIFFQIYFRSISFYPLSRCTSTNLLIYINHSVGRFETFKTKHFYHK